MQRIHNLINGNIQRKLKMKITRNAFKMLMNFKWKLHKEHQMTESDDASEKEYQRGKGVRTRIGSGSENEVELS